MATVTFKDASRIYPKATRKAVDQLSLDVGDGEFVVLITAAPDVIVRVDPRGAPKSGDNVELHVAENSMLLFERESGARMRES